MNKSFRYKSSTNTYIMTNSINPVKILQPKKNVNSLFKVSECQSLLPNTNCLFVRKAVTIVSNHAIIVLPIIEKKKMWLNI